MLLLLLLLLLFEVEVVVGVVFALVDVTSCDGLIALRNEYGRGLTVTDGAVGRSCDVNDVEACIRVDAGIGGVKLELR